MKTVLSTVELRNLLKVETSKAQAQSMLKKFTRILLLLRAKLPGSVRIRCPHCDMDCRSCAYNIPEFNADIENRSSLGCEFCLNVPFGGVTYWDQEPWVQLSISNATVMDAGCSSDRLTPEKYRRALRWVAGHIGWANEVIRRASGKRKHCRSRTCTCSTR